MILRALSLPSLVAITWALMPSFSLAKDENPFGTRDQPVVAAADAGDLVISPVLADKLPVKTVKIGHVGEPGQPTHEELSVLFEAFQAQYAAAADGKILPALPWKDGGLFEITVTVQQDPQQGLYLLGNDAANCIVVKISGPATWAVGVKLHIYASKTGVQEWTDAAGTAQKSPLYEPVAFPFPARPDAPTRKQFVAALRVGQSFAVLVPEAGAKDSPPRLIVQKLTW